MTLLPIKWMLVINILANIEPIIVISRLFIDFKTYLIIAVKVYKRLDLIKLHFTLLNHMFHYVLEYFEWQIQHSP